MKSDSKIQQDVMDELDWEPSVDHANIGVAVKDGIVTLSGHVRSYMSKLSAEKAARRVEGVRGIAEEIETRFINDSQTDDDQIAKRIADSFDWNVNIPGDKIDIKVENGWVTLSGEVEWHFESSAAKDSVAGMAGVKLVTNSIKVKQVPSTADIKDRIVSALKRNADIDAKTITVSKTGHTVKLGGKVQSWNERRVAERAAWAAPGVSKVVDNILVV